MTQSLVAGTAWHSPGQIYNVGHRSLQGFFDHPVQVQEKIDGSFFAFGLFPEIDKGEGPLRIRSKGAVMHPDAPEALFRSAVATVKELAEKGMLHPGWQYRGEVLAKPKHNALAYNRTPKDNIILFDICVGEEDYLPYPELAAEAARLGLEVVPQVATFDAGECSAEKLLALLDRESVLGGQKIEGVVCKPMVPLFSLDKKLLMAKFVSEGFKEVHGREWKLANPTRADIVQALIARFTTAARWQKALIHLKEQGKIEGTLRDIGLLIREVPPDILKEEEAFIKDALFKWAWPHIARGVTQGLPQWYKELLVKEQFRQEAVDDLHAVGEQALVDMLNDAKGG
jgi:hypothetical protein